MLQGTAFKRSLVELFVNFFIYMTKENIVT